MDCGDLFIITMMLVALVGIGMVITEEKDNDWELFFEGETINEKMVFPNEKGGENYLLFPPFEVMEEKIVLFLDENLAVVTPENSSWKVLIFPDEEKFIVYQKR